MKGNPYEKELPPPHNACNIINHLSKEERQTVTPSKNSADEASRRLARTAIPGS